MEHSPNSFSGPEGRLGRNYPQCSLRGKAGTAPLFPAPSQKHPNLGTRWEGAYLLPPSVGDGGLAAAHTFSVVEVRKGPCCPPGLQIAGYTH